MIQSLYRGKRKDNGEWHEGHLVQMDGRAFIVSAYTASNDPRDVGQVVYYDKDRQNVFLGDYLRGENPNVIYEMKMLPGMAAPLLVDVQPRYYNSIPAESARYCELIGNRWDNPTLLSVKPS